MLSAIWGSIHQFVSVQAAIEGLSLMLQNQTAPPPTGMPPVDMPPAEAPKPPSEVLIGGAGPSPAGGELELSTPMSENGSGAEAGRGGGWLGGGMFGSRTANV